MYKVFLADDEVVVREGIRSSFPWETSNFVLAGEAPDGEIALSLLREIKPDILITDIRMPFMDGLELCRQTRAQLPWVKTIILTGYDEFTYAKEALALGVKEYLLKPVSAQELDAALKRVAALINEERRQDRDIQLARSQLSQSSGLIRDQFLSAVMRGALPAEARSDLFVRAREMDIDLLARQYRVMLLSPAQPAPEQMLPLRALISRLTEARAGMQGLFCRFEGLILLLLKGETAEELDEGAFWLAQTVKHEAEVPLRIAIGAVVSHVFALGDSYQAALRTLQAMNDHYAREDTRIMDSAELQLKVDEVLSLADNAGLYEQLRFTPIGDIDRILSAYFLKAGEGQSVMMLNYLFVESILTAARIVQELGLDPQAELPESRQVNAPISMFSKYEEVFSAARAVVGRALSLRDRQSLSRYHEVIAKACAYIDSQFADPNLTLADAAGHVHLSVNHFCTVFSQETNTTFIEYLTRLRMEKARELLLSSALRSSDIAQRVGYRDPHYFGYLFKKNFFISPRDYRALHKDTQT